MIALKPSTIAILAAAGVVLVVLAARKGADVVGKIASTSLNPASDENLAYRAATAATQTLTGNATDTVGTWLYGLVNGQRDREVSEALGLQKPRAISDPLIGASMTDQQGAPLQLWA